MSSGLLNGFICPIIYICLDKELTLDDFKPDFKDDDSL